MNEPLETEFLSFDDILQVHDEMISISGGSRGIRDRGGIESALAQPRMTFGGEDMYPGVVDKAAALGFSLTKNHAFVDGNKRVGHAAMELFLDINGYDLVGDVDEQEKTILALAASEIEREEFTEWVREHVQRR